MTRAPRKPEPAPDGASRQRFDDAVLKGVFLSLAAVVMMALGYDLSGRLADEAAGAAALPYLPSARPGVAAPGLDPADGRQLAGSMSIELVGGGRLVATGTIQPGTAERFAAELDRRGEYVKTVVLDSPGGSVRDALEMARMIRARGLDTRIEADGRCASSCPLVFAGGVARVAVDGAAVGVHQVSSVPGAIAPAPDRGRDMAEAQRITAECQRLLVEMGVDPRVWIHAMETPAEEIFYFTAEELVELSLATSTAATEG